MIVALVTSADADLIIPCCELSFEVLPNYGCD
jgi:hypothetical protein